MQAMSLHGARVEAVLAVLELEAEHGDHVDVRDEFVVVVRGPSGSQCRYGSGPGIARVTRGTPPLQQHFDFLARDSLGDLVTDMRDDGYDGPDPLTEFTIEWRISTDVAEALHRLAD